MDLDRLAEELLAREGVDPLTDAQCRAIVDFAMAVGGERAATKAMKNEADFIAGVLATFFALGRGEKAPAKFFFGKNLFKKGEGDD